MLNLRHLQLYIPQRSMLSLYFLASTHLCVCVCVYVCELSCHVQLFVTLWILSHQGPLSMGFSIDRLVLPFSVAVILCLSPTHRHTEYRPVCTSETEKERV